MLGTIVVVLVALWAVSFALGGSEPSKGMIHVLLFGAVIAVVLQRVSRRVVHR